MRKRFGHLAVLHDTEGGAVAPDAGNNNAQASDTANTQSQGDGTESGADSPKSYTQAEVDALIAQKLRGSGKEIERLKAFEAEAQKRAEEEQQRKEAEMTELEKAKQSAAEASARAAELEETAKAAKAEALAERVNSEIKLLISSHGPVDDGVYALVPAAAKEVDENGARTDAAKKALDDWIESKTGSLLRGRGVSSGPAATRGSAKTREYGNPLNAQLLQNRNNLKAKKGWRE